MINLKTSLPTKQRVLQFLWQHCLLCFSLFLMTLGVALNVRSDLGSSVISAIPLAFSEAGSKGIVPPWSLGGYTIAMNFVLVGLQILILRSRFEWLQLLQLVIGFLFGLLIDVNMYLTSFFTYDGLIAKIAAQFLGCTVLGVGIAAEVRCGSVTMPGEGVPLSLTLVTHLPFAKLKIYVDVTLVTIAVICGYLFQGSWQWNVVGPGTLFAMFYVGFVVKLLNPHMSWFDRLLNTPPHPGRYLFGLARLLYKKKN